MKKIKYACCKKNYDIIRKHLGNRSFHLNEYGASWFAMIYVATIRKLWKSVDNLSCSSDGKPTESKDKDVFQTCETAESRVLLKY